MRADRLISMLMLLQFHRKLTACRLAEELQVSVRTIYRDVIALNSAGVPVYAEKGPGGGICLVEEYRTTLTGLSAQEVRALFMLSVPSPLEELGFSQELKGALLKLDAALSESRKQEGESARQRIHLDWSPWINPAQPLAYLQVLQQAVWSDHQIVICYLPTPVGWIEPIQLQVQPYGLVAKAGSWYLICDYLGHKRVIEVSTIKEVALCKQAFQRKQAFNLELFWKGWCKEYQENRTGYVVRLRFLSKLKPYLPFVFGTSVEIRPLEMDETGHPDWINAVIIFESFRAARTTLLGLGSAVEVLAPQSLRLSVADFAEQISNIYQHAG